MKKNILLFLLGISLYNNLHSQPFTRASIDTVAAYIKSLQFTDPTKPAFGALKKTRAIGQYGSGKYFSIEPYFNHIGALGMLQSDNPAKCQLAKNWMNWWFNHLDSKGKTLNHYYKADGTGETTCPPGATGVNCNDIDAEDSDLALLWGLAYQYYLTSGDVAFFTPAIKTQFYQQRLLIQSSPLPFCKSS